MYVVVSRTIRLFKISLRHLVMKRNRPPINYPDKGISFDDNKLQIQLKFMAREIRENSVTDPHFD